MDGQADASALGGSIDNSPLFYILDLGAAMGPPQPQECPFGGFQRVFC